MPTVVFSINLNSSATTCILEGVKQNVDKSTVSLCLEDVRFDAERIYVFYITYQYREMPSSYQRRVMAPGVIKNGHVHEVNEPSYLISLNVEDLVGKIKDAAKSLEGYAVVSLACSNSGIRFLT
ncbi:COMM domain-containing protein 3 isoform X2 [Oncorhynchus nerka]|uniref:COMM domain-containing protein 3 isoform X2 n=1 Tax=Oncorhynchus nerka TaxID=8023 RepID=UPI0011329000|nr:COMM domain-containing protein 3-like isoform X2 [Oncorhynchus nerka]